MDIINKKSNDRILKTTRIYWFRLLFILNIFAIVILSVIPSPDVAIGNFDKLGHFSAYFAVTVLMLLAIKTKTNRTVSVIGLIALGALLEWVQSFIPGRSMSIYDEITNTIGVVSGGILGGLCYAFKLHLNKIGKKE